MKKILFIYGLAVYVFLVLTAGNSPAFAQVNLRWVKSMGGAGTDGGVSVCTDAAGNVYTAGTFIGKVDFDPGPGTDTFTTAGSSTSDIFICKFDANGNYLWTKTIGGNVYAEVTSIVPDNAGNIYMTGGFMDTVDFDPGPATDKLVAASAASSGGVQYLDAFVCKLDGNGNYIWAKRMGGPKTDQGTHMSVDGAGNAYITGIFTDTSDFDPGPGTHNLVANGPWENMFMCKLDASGNYVWAWGTGSGTYATTWGVSVIVDAAGLYVLGHYGSTIDLDPGPVVHNLTPSYTYYGYQFTGGQNTFVAKYDTAGNYQWAYNIVGGLQTIGYSLAMDAAGNLYACGTYTDAADHGLTSTGLYNTLNNKIYVCKLDSNGNHIWARSISGTNSSSYVMGQLSANSIAADNSGIYMTGRFTDTVDFNPGTATNYLIANKNTNNYGDAYVCKLDTAGNYIWAMGMGSRTHSDEGKGIHVDAYGSIYTTGYFSDTAADFDPGPDTSRLISRGSGEWGGDIFVLKLYQPCSVSVNMTRSGCDSLVFNGKTYYAGGIYRDTLVSATGCDTVIMLNAMLHESASSRLTDTACGNAFTLNGQTYTQTGIYTQTFSSAAGCDSTVTLDLTLVRIPHAVITVNGSVLGTTVPYDTYQWLRNGVKIPGATDSIYVVTANDKYSVAVTSAEGCTDTSGIYLVTNVGVMDIAALREQIHIYPNPASAVVYVAAPMPVNISVSSPDGKMILHRSAAGEIDISPLANGMYLLTVTGSDGQLLLREKVVKTE